MEIEKVYGFASGALPVTFGVTLVDGIATIPNDLIGVIGAITDITV